jgi:hypothetical protein
MPEKVYLFRAHGGRVTHASAVPIEDPAQHGRYWIRPGRSLCGAYFEHVYKQGGRAEPTCPKCLKALQREADRVAMRDRLVSEFPAP